MNVRVKYYLWLSSRTGVSEEVYSLPSGSLLRNLLEEVAKSRPELRSLVENALSGRSELIVLLNSKSPSRGLETPLSDNDLVELLPPVSGG